MGEFILFIEQYMRVNELSAAAFGKRVGVSHTTVNRWLKGGVPDLTQLAKLSDATGADLCYLVGMIYPTQTRRNRSPELNRIVEQIRGLPTESQKLVDTLIMALSIKNVDSNTDER